MKKIIFTTILALVISAVFAGNPEIKSVNEEYYDFLVLTGRSERPYIQYRNLTTNNYSNKQGFWSSKDLGESHDSNRIKVYLPEFKATYNTNRPYGQNDTGLWQGVGFNIQAKAGFSLNLKYLSLTLKPEFNFSQNKAYETFKYNYDYFWFAFDLPQRFGEATLLNFNFGDSEVRLHYKNFTLGAGTQSRWLGNNQLNAVLLSNNAEPFPYVDLGLNKTNIQIGKINFGCIEGHYSVGILQNSNYNNCPNMKSLLHVISVAYAPSFIDGFSVGVNATGHTDYSWAAFKNYFKVLTREVDNGANEDSKFSVSADWLIPSLGFEIYGEFGKDDYSYNNPFHTAVFQFGIKKAFTFSESKKIYGVLTAEIGSMECSKDSFNQWQYHFYSHAIYNYDGLSNTHKGQMLGAGTGFSGKSQYIGFTTLYSKGLTTIFVQRSNPDTDYVYCKESILKRNQNYQDYTNTFKTNYDFGVKTTYFTKYGFNINAAFVFEPIFNEYYRELADGSIGPKTLTHNEHFELGLNFTL